MLWRGEHTPQETGGAADLAEISNAHAAVTRAQVTQADDSHEAAVLGGGGGDLGSKRGRFA